MAKKTSRVNLNSASSQFTGGDDGLMKTLANGATYDDERERQRRQDGLMKETQIWRAKERWPKVVP